MTVFALAKLADSRDPETGEHLERMRSYCQILAEELSREGPYTKEIDDQFLGDLYRSSPLHDIGKVGIPDVILLKSGRLSQREFAIMQRHAVIGAEMLASAATHTHSGGFLQMAADIARCHHERFDGTGYPAGLEGYAIPLPARIVALADVYDALTAARVYKSAFEPEVAKAMIEAEEGRHFDPAVVEAFRRRFEDFLDVLGLRDVYALHSAAAPCPDVLGDIGRSAGSDHPSAVTDSPPRDQTERANQVIARSISPALRTASGGHQRADFAH